MELRVNVPTINEAITFNFDELKEGIQAKASEYTNLVYTDEDIKAAKADVATFRKLQKAINDEKIRVKKECLKPYEDFENKVKELLTILDEPIKSISAQVTHYEDQRKHEKLEEISAYWQELHEDGKIPTGINLMQIMNEKWLNASVKMSAITKEIDEHLEKIKNDLVTIENLPEFGYEAKEEYLRTLDMSKAILEGQRQAEIQKRKQEAQIKEEPKKEEPKPEEPKTRLEFWVNVTKGQAEGLRMYLDVNNIEFGQIGGSR